MRRSKLFLILTVLAGAACAPVAETVEWHGWTLREVRTLGELPGPVRVGLGVERVARRTGSSIGFVVAALRYARPAKSAS